MTDEEHLASLQHTVNLLMMEGNKFIDDKVRKYARQQGYVIKPGKEGIKEFEEELKRKGKVMKIEMSDFNINEEKQGIIQAVQELRIRIIPDLGGNGNG